MRAVFKIGIIRTTRSLSLQCMTSGEMISGGGGRLGMARWLADTVLILSLILCIGGGSVFGAHWAHHIELEPNYSLYWTPGEQDITFELQVRSLGYVGFGFSLDGQMIGADMVVGWVRDNQVFFQDRFSVDRGEPKVDPSQDYELLLGYENGTHTVLRFRRRYDTCDDRDIRITNDTMRILWAYHADDPAPGGGLTYHGQDKKGSQSLYLMENPGDNKQSSQHDGHNVWDITNTQVPLPALEDTLYWCRIVKLPNIKKKHHIIGYEPLHESDNKDYIHHMIVYECPVEISHERVIEYEDSSRSRGQPCYPTDPVMSACNTVVLTWNKGSQGFTFPPEAGYPLEPDSGPKYYMMMTHYNNPSLDGNIIDSSGLRVYYTTVLRRHDAGVLSMGLDPNWRHIIPPGQPKVVSEGHCIADCTRQTIPPQGINIFSVILHTHLIGRQIRLRQIRDGEELTPIAVDNNYDSNYQESRHLVKPARVLPGDHLITECVYNSVDRTTITLGGLTTREEKCLVYGLYYPRINLSLCHSLPSLPTVLHSLGIQELWPESNPVSIKSPRELADMTLEKRLITYDWENNFQSFQEVTHKGSFKPLCLMKPFQMHMVNIDMESFYPNISYPFKERQVCPNNKWKKPRRRKKPGDLDPDNDLIESDESKSFNNIEIHESSRLKNFSAKRQCSVLVVVVVSSAILFYR